MAGSWEMALLRGLHLAAMLSLLGTLAFIAWMVPGAPDRHERLRATLVRVWWISGALAVLAGAGWLTMETAAIAGTQSLAELPDALPLVVGQTRFGQVVGIRLILLVVATALAGAGKLRVYPALLLTAAAAALEGVIGHAGATGGTVGDGLVLSEALHLLAAGLWLGALLPLWLAVRALPLPSAASVCERFSPIGLGCVLVLAGTGFAQALELIGSLPALLGTPYGHIAVLKIGLFLVALVLAACNRLWLTDRLADEVPPARRHLLVSVAIETLIGLTIIMAAAFLASNVPGVHEQPVWPLPWRFSLTTVNEDAAFRQEVIVSLLLIGGAVLLLVAALVWRRFRLLALAALVGAIAWRGPSLSLLTAEAYPTSFQTSPTQFAVSSIVHGQSVFAASCVSCHGADGTGNGPAAAALPIKPADLTQPHIWEHSDGELFWWLSHGIDNPEGGTAMPGFAGKLSDQDLWALIDYVRAHAAGAAVQRRGTFDGPVRAPAIAVSCDGLPASRLSDLAGQAVHVVTTPGENVAVPPQLGVRTVTLELAANGPPEPPQGGCVAADPAAWDGYAVVAGLAPGALAGTEFLIDPNGWLRAVRRPPDAASWHSPDELAAAVRAICATPVALPTGESHGHHH